MATENVPGLELIEKLKPKIIPSGPRIRMGFEINDARGLLPPEHLLINGSPGMVPYFDDRQLFAPMVRAIQELSDRVEKLEQENTSLRGTPISSVHSDDSSFVEVDEN